MSKLDELIKELCPDGVEYKKIKDVYKRLRGTPITASKMKEIENPNGDIRIFAGGKNAINAFANDIPNLNVVVNPAVLVQSRGNIDFIYYERPFTFKNEMWAYTHEDKVSVKFLYYILKNNASHFRKLASGMGSLPQISLRVTEDFRVPVPPMEVQREIVKILDNFTELTAELTDKLSEELTARKKQYEYYRDRLLTFDKGTITSKKLGETCWLKAGKAISSNDISTEKSDEFPFACYGGNGIRGYVSQFTYDVDCPIIGRQGALCGNVQYAVGKFYPTEHAVVVRSKGDYDQRFLYYLLTYMNLNQYKSAGAQPGLSVKNLENVKAPVPPITIQKSLVNVLDNFDKVCNDLHIGLPAEIEARKKQYEFYRDSLLTFLEKGESILTEQNRTKVRSD